MKHPDLKQKHIISNKRPDIALDSSMRIDLWNWAIDNGIYLEYQGTRQGLDLWYIKNESHRAWFALRWS